MGERSGPSAASVLNMNPRWLALGALVLIPVAGCSTTDDSATKSPLSFSAVAAASDRSDDASARPETVPVVPVAAPGTVCGSVPTSTGTANVVVKAGRANCVDALRVATAYAAAASNAQGQAVTVESAGWRCSARVTDSVATCANGANTFTVG